MSPKLPLAYRFASEAQWNECMFAGVDRNSRKARNGLRPVRALCGSSGALPAPAGGTTTTHVSEVVWRDDRAGCIACDDYKQRVVTAPRRSRARPVWLQPPTPCGPRPPAVVGELRSRNSGASARRRDSRCRDRGYCRPAAMTVCSSLLERRRRLAIAQYDCAGQLLSSVRARGPVVAVGAGLSAAIRSPGRIGRWISSSTGSRARAAGQGSPSLSRRSGPASRCPRSAATDAGGW